MAPALPCRPARRWLSSTRPPPMKVSTKTYRKLGMLRPRPATSSATQAAAVSLSTVTGRSQPAATLARRSVSGQRAATSGGMSSRVCQPPRLNGTAMPTPCTRPYCAPPPVCECGASVHVNGKPMRHQVFDVPPIKARLDEYRLYSGRCTACGKPHRAVLPAGVPSGQLDARALALVGVLGTRYHLTQQKTRDLLAQLMGVDFSVGAISQAHGKVTEALRLPLAEATASLPKATVLHKDETHCPREGSGNWVWAVVQPGLVVYSILPSRARYVINDLIGKTLTAVMVSGRYAGYAHIDASQRQVCGAECGRQVS